MLKANLHIWCSEQAALSPDFLSNLSWICHIIILEQSVFDNKGSNNAVLFKII